MSEPTIIDAHQHVGGLGNALGTWGEDSEGQLGDGGVATNSQSPIAVDASAW